jgi:hypothetical protein
LAAHPSEQWAANCAHFQLAMLAYNLNCWLMLFNREEKVHPDDLKHTTLVTVRLRFLFVAAKIWRHAGRVGISYSDQYPERGLFQRLRNIVSSQGKFQPVLASALQRDTNDRERLREKSKSNDAEHTGEKKLMRSEFRLLVPAMVPMSPNCVFDGSLVPETCLEFPCLAMCSLAIWFGKLRPLKQHGASCPTISVAPVLAITSMVAMTSWLRFFDPLESFLNRSSPGRAESSFSSRRTEMRT